MHVLCRCGAQFPVSVERLPCNVQCSNCDGLFHIAQDGSAVPLAKPQALSIEAVCRCGQAFTIHAGRFPHKVSCHACGRRFIVLDDGTTSSPDEPSGEVSNGKGIASTAIHLEPAASMQAPLANVCIEEIKVHFEAEHAEKSLNSSAIVTVEMKDSLADSAITKRDAAKKREYLEAIDLLWRIERQGHSLVPVFGLEIMPSFGMAFLIAGLIVCFWFILWCYCISAGMGAGSVGSLMIAVFAFPTVVIFLVFLLREAKIFAQAEALWRANRLAAIKESYSDR